MYVNAILKDERTAKWMTNELKAIDFHLSELNLRRCGRFRGKNQQAHRLAKERFRAHQETDGTDPAKDAQRN